jgi:hypothetical protein
MAHQGRIALDTQIETPQEGYVNLRFDPITQSLIVKFSTDHEKVIAQAVGGPVGGEDEIDGGTIFGNNLSPNTRQNLRW